VSGKGGKAADKDMVIDADAEEEHRDTTPTSSVPFEAGGEGENNEEPDLSEYSGKTRRFSQDGKTEALLQRGSGSSSSENGWKDTRWQKAAQGWRRRQLHAETAKNRHS